jgi:hypothetical protein
MLAVATASWIARLMPTPPIGDMVCAASPMHRKSRSGPLREPVDSDRQQADILPVAPLLQPAAQRRFQPGDLLAERFKTSFADAIGLALGDDKGGLPVRVAVQQH